MQTIYLDISNRSVTPIIYAKQGDVGRKVEVILTNSGLPYEPEAGSAFSAWFSGASGVGNYTDVGERSAFSVSGNKVTVEMITQMLQNAGEGALCLVLNRSNGDQIGLWNIRYICEAVPGAGSEAAKQYYTAFSEAVADLTYTDASLSVAGKAADAAATGNALAGKAPAVESEDHAGCYYRTVDGAVEWINPPMILGVEYRTTERWNGEPVYTMAINFGALPNSGTRSVESVVNADAEDIRIDGITKSGNTSKTLWSVIDDAQAYANHTSKGFVALKTSADRSDYTATVILKYVVRP